jgi:alpha-N-arabinofuranosidase
VSSAKIVLHPSFVVAPIDRRIFGGFVEHLGRCVYTGIYEPEHPTADAEGFRSDVIELVKELGVSVVRYPGGNFVSGYNWEDGVGPKDQRPRRLDLAWHSTETNQVGLDEFASWVKKINGELVLALNLGTRGVAEALDLLEYANLESGTQRSDERIANGQVEPHAVRTWCLGNEIDGPWQLGHKSAEDYGKLAHQTAEAMRQVDPSLELVVCGSSKPTMPTFGEWERVVLENSYESVDYISCHAYYEEFDGDLASFLASGVDVDRYIDAVIATIDHVKAELHSEKTVDISFDEWNVWYNPRFKADKKSPDPQDWPVAPALLEDVYSVADAVVVGGILISLLRHADRVKIANLAQLVNVIAPITTEPGGSVWRQTTFFPFAEASRHAQGDVLQLSISSDRYQTAAYGEADVVDAVATHDAATGKTSIFLINRGIDGPAEVVLDLSAFGVTKVESFTTLSDDDVYAKNTREDQNRVAPHLNENISLNAGEVRVTLPAVSWSTLLLA